MRSGAFELVEPLPELKEPHVLSIIRPWMDAGNASSMMLSRLEAYFDARDLGRLARPGNFLDFTRCRPLVYNDQGTRRVVVPNTFLTYAKRESGNDFIFLNMTEPHMLAEIYVDSIVRLFTIFGVKRYCLLGSMYDLVPHTRPLLITGRGGKSMEQKLGPLDVQSSDYEGPTTIIHLVSQHAAEMGIETMSFIVHLPQYTQLDNDYAGMVRLMELLHSIYDIPVDEDDTREAEKQRRNLDAVLDHNPRMKNVVTQLEEQYEARFRKDTQKDSPRLAPEVEQFLKEMEQRFRQG